jgi:preprotein translocase subunit SecF
MIKFFKNKSNFKFTKFFSKAMTISGVLFAISIWAIIYKLNYGVDFRGGAEIQTKFAKEVQLDTLRDVLSKNGFSSATVQTIGEKGSNEILVKIPGDEKNLNELTDKASIALKAAFVEEKIEIEKIDIVGPKAGANLRNSAVLAMIWAMAAILVYLALRFDFIYAPGAIVASLHDPIIALGALALIGGDFTLQVVAALLALIGYSVNDTVVVYDRIREHQHQDKSLPFETHIDDAINQTLSRTILTSVATLSTCIIMYFFGGAAIKDFFFVMCVGIIVGSYSSIFIASPFTLLMAKFKKN